MGQLPSGSSTAADKFDAKEGEDTVQIGSRSLKVYKVESKAKDGSMQSTSWMSREVPGYAVKSVSKMGGTESLVEVVDFEAKK